MSLRDVLCWWIGSITASLVLYSVDLSTWWVGPVMVIGGSLGYYLMYLLMRSK